MLGGIQGAAFRIDQKSGVCPVRPKGAFLLQRQILT